MGRVDDAQRLASQQGRAAAPAQAAPEPAPWAFGDDARAPSSAPGAPSAAEPREEPRGHRAMPEQAGEKTPLQQLDPETAERFVVSARGSEMLVEQFRVLAATLHHAQAAQTLKTVMVTSAVVGDGKSLVATNLALTLSESYRRQVLLVDADLRRPSLHRLFRVLGTTGLNEGLKAESDEKLALVRISETLTLLPAGRPSADPMAGLSSARMRHIIDEAAARFDWVILDTPPVGVLADASVLSGMVDGAILVVKSGVTPFPQVEAAVAALGRDHILGVLLNAVDPADIHDKGYYYHYYGPDGDERRSTR